MPAAPVAEEFKATLIGSNEDFHAQTKEQQEATALHENRDGNPLVDCIYAHFDAFRILLCCAGGSSYEHYMDDLVAILECPTRRFMEATGHEAAINGKKAGEKTVHNILILKHIDRTAPDGQCVSLCGRIFLAHHIDIAGIPC